MNPGYQGQQAPGGFQPQAGGGYGQGTTPMPMPGGGGGAPTPAKKSPPLLFISAGLLALMVACNWLVGAFKIDGDGGRFFTHTAVASGTMGLGILMLVGFSRLSEKDKEHPATLGLGLVVCVLITAVISLAALLQFR